MTPQAELVLIGAVIGAFGVRGEVRVRSFTQDAENLGAYGPLLRSDGSVALTPKQLRPISGGVAITAPEIRAREDAEALKGTGLYVHRSALPETEDDEYYHIDLIGCAVESLAGEPFGIVKSVQNFGAGDLLEVALASGQTWFLPFTREAAPLVEIKARRIVAAEGPPKPGADAP
jgi:16S rRNA processing protein RimM